MQKIIFFDGVCNLCNRSVNFLIKQDKKGVLKFASLQSDFAKSFLPQDIINSVNLDSIIFSDGVSFYTKSSAVLAICKSLGGGFHFFRIGYLLPIFIRDGLYRLIANNRYKWFGKTEQCGVPTEALKDRFLD
ncbi:DCC1-like thiol-disulfide oxidoreductase family protein [Flavobacteriaceae bacterium]|nr:DCC1-like thiol-disulfide oxidoreductase family protein [Flavobacteriaceae bacterium]